METAVPGAYNVSLATGEASCELPWLRPAEVEFLLQPPEGVAANTPVVAHLMPAESVMVYLRRARTARRLTVPQLSEGSGISASTIYKTEWGIKGDLRIPSLGRLYRAMGGLLCVALTEKREPEKPILVPCDNNFPLVIGQCCREQRKLLGVQVKGVIEYLVQAGRCLPTSKDVVSRFETSKDGTIPLMGTVEAHYAALAIAVQYCALPGPKC